MMTNGTKPTALKTRPLAGAAGWLITDGKAGMDVQVKGVSDALGLDCTVKHVSPSPMYKTLAPWGPVDPKEKFGQPGGQYGPPWPTVAIATGRVSIPYMRRLHRLAGISTYCVVLQDPKVGAGVADLIWVPEHDRRRGPNVMTTPTAPHSFSPSRLENLRGNPPPAISALPSPRIAVVLGGKNGVYRFTDNDDDRLQAALKYLASLGASFMITPSRRTHQRLLGATVAATDDRPRIVWDGSPPNPYPDFLAHADFLIVTADSVNMTGEACATGRPVFVFKPTGSSAKFDKFHMLLQSLGATRELPQPPISLDGWHYNPLHSAETIAGEIERRWQRRSEMLPGLMAKSRN